MKRIYLVGFMASGKTTIGKIVAKKLGYDFIDLDHFIERRFFKSVTEIFNEKGEERFREIEKNCLAEISAFENVLIATGGGTPCFYDNMQLMNDTGETFYLYFSAKDLVYRLGLTNKSKRPLIAQLSDEELTQYVEKKLLERTPFYEQAKHIVKGDDRQMAYEICEKVNSII